MSHESKSPENYQIFTDLLLKMTYTKKAREPGRFYTITLCTLLHFINKTTIVMLWTRRILSPTSGFCLALLLFLVCYCRPSSATAFPSIQCVFGKRCVLRPPHLPGVKRLQDNIRTQTEQENIKPQTPTEGQTAPSSVEFVRFWNPNWHIKTFQSRFVSPTTQLSWFLWHYTYNIYTYIH